MRVYLLLILVVLFSSCVRNKNGVVGMQNTANAVSTKVFEVAEVIQASNYTYMKVKENSNERWVAVSKQDVNVGDVYYYDEALQMTNFASKDLDRTFEEIYFVNQISKTPLVQDNMMGGGMPAHSGKVVTEQLSSVTLEKSGDEVTVADIYSNRAEYTSKEFEIRGIVIKVNPEVMGKNWIHIQDGTNSNSDYDLTITSLDMAQKGDEVVFKGKVTLNKDFGAGYRYDVIMEDASLVSKKEATMSL